MAVCKNPRFLDRISKIRLLIHDYAGHPFPVQLSRELASRGHQVLHLYAGYNQTPRGVLSRRVEDPSSLHIRGVFIREPLEKDNLIKRWIQEREYGRLVAAEISKYRPAIVISAQTPLDAQKPLLSECQAQDARFIFWLQDFLGIGARSILSRKLPLIGNLIGMHYVQLEKSLVTRSDLIVVITEDFCPILEAWGISNERIEIIPNWAPIEELPLCAKGNLLSREHALHKRFTFLYTGTLRMKHNPALLLELAKRTNSNQPFAQLIVVSEGPGTEWLLKQAAAIGVENLRVLDFQPMERYGEVLASADVLVAILEKEAGAFSVPSKVLSYLCAKRPLLLAVPKENLAARIVQRAKAGIVVEPDDLEGFIQGAKTLMANPDLRNEMGQNARRYAEEAFDIKRIAERFEELIARL